LWEAHKKAVGGNTSGNNCQTTPETTIDQADTTPCETKGQKVRLSGLEPETYGLKVRCSIQLSYSPKTFAVKGVTLCRYLSEKPH
jgi:hypothetical protein